VAVAPAVHCPRMHGQPAMHAVETAEYEALLKVATTWRKVEEFAWARFLVAWAALFHATAAVILFVVPDYQLLTPATTPVFDLLPPAAWAFLFLGGAVSLAALWAEPSHWFGFVVLMGVLLIGGAWLTTFGLAVVRDGSSPLGLVVWFFLYVPFLVGINKRASGKR